MGMRASQKDTAAVKESHQTALDIMSNASDEDVDDRIDEDDADEPEEALDGEANDEGTRTKKKKIHKLSLSSTQDYNQKLKRRGVIYMSRIPPRMNPPKVKSLLSDFGCDVTRLYLAPEDASQAKRRRKAGKSGAKRYIEGWVEFESKRIAKQVAQSLNNTPISNQKRNPHYGDLWNLKYLPKFQWAHLTEKVAYERRVREQKLRIEMVHARKEQAAFTKLVETGQKLDLMDARRIRKRKEALPAVRRPAKQHKPLNDKGAKDITKAALLTSLV